MKLLLTSSGFIDNSLEKDFLDLVGSHKNLKVAIIPTAGDPIEWVPEKEGDQVKDYVYKLIPEKKEQNAAWLHSYQKEWEKKGLAGRTLAQTKFNFSNYYLKLMKIYESLTP